MLDYLRACLEVVPDMHRGRLFGLPPRPLRGKCLLLEPHFGYFHARSAAMGMKMSLLRTQNQPFSLPKHHLQTCSKGLSKSAENKALAAEVLYKEKKLSLPQICLQLGICKSTLYNYLRHRGVMVKGKKG